MRAKFLVCLVFTIACVVGILSTIYHGFQTTEVVELLFSISITVLYWFTWTRDYRDSRDVYSPEGYLIGYRLLTKTESHWHSAQFRSPFRDYYWKQGWNEAKDWDLDFPHGLYSMRSKRRTEFRNRASMYTVVQVELAGNIVIHERGYRSQYARVSAIIGNDDVAAEYFGVRTIK